MANRALRAPLEEHQRAERMRSGGVAAQKVQVQRQADQGGAREEPGSEETHQFLP